MAPNLSLFGQNVFLLIGILLVAVLLFVVLIVGWTGISLLVWRRQRQRAVLESAPWPRTRGICGACGRASEDVYHFPSGVRRCEACYQRGNLGRCERANGAARDPVSKGGY